MLLRQPCREHSRRGGGGGGGVLEGQGGSSHPHPGPGRAAAVQLGQPGVAQTLAGLRAQAGAVVDGAGGECVGRPAQARRCCGGGG